MCKVSGRPAENFQEIYNKNIHQSRIKEIIQAVVYDH